MPRGVKSARWSKSTGLWTREGLSEFPNDGAESSGSLASLLEPTPDPKYLLTPKACAGILRRAEKRGKTLPEPLAVALAAVAGRPTQTE